MSKVISTSSTTAHAAHPAPRTSARKASLRPAPQSSQPPVVPVAPLVREYPTPTCSQCGATVVARMNILAQLMYLDCTKCAHYTTQHVRF